MTVVLVATLIFGIAALYASVGLAGASGYLAALAVAGVDPVVMKPSALTLNVVVATIATLRFRQAKDVSPSLFWPLAATAIPASYLGGAIHLPDQVYRPLAAITLLVAAGPLLRPSRLSPGTPRKITGNARVSVLTAGGAIGLISGLTGTGGGIFLAPILLASGWADARQAIGVTAAFVLATSAAALGGHLAHLGSLPASLVWWAPAAALGGALGAEFGRRRAGSLGQRRVLAVLLIVAAIRLLLF